MHQRLEQIDPREDITHLRIEAVEESNSRNGGVGMARTGSRMARKS
jgi:hypothetical protein